MEIAQRRMQQEAAGHTLEGDGIGARLRDIRKARAETLQEVAKTAGISVSALSKIENGKMSPTFGNLMKLAEGLQISLSELVATGLDYQPSSARLAITRSHDIQYRRTPGYDIGPLCADLVRKRMTPFIEHVRSRYPLGEDGHISHSGEEFVYVLDGDVDVLTDNYAPMRLTKGDSIYLDSRMQHTYVSVSRKDARILMIWLSSDHKNSAASLEAAEAMLNEKPAGT